MAQVVNERFVNYTYSGTQSFTFSFKIYDTDEIKVFLNGVLLTLTADYTVSLFQTPIDGGIVTIINPLTFGDEISLISNLKDQRRTTFSSGGDYSSEAINSEYDISRGVSTEILTDTQQTVRLAIPDPNVDLSLPPPEDGKNLKWVESPPTFFSLTNTVYDSDTLAEEANQSAIDAANSANQSSVSAGLSAVSAADAAQSALDAEAAAATLDLTQVEVDIKPKDDGIRKLGGNGVTPKRWANVYSDNLDILDEILLNSENLIVPKAAQIQYRAPDATTQGGSALISPAINQRPLNTIQYNTIGTSVTLIDNNFTIPAGKYLINIKAEYKGVGNARTILIQDPLGTQQQIYEYNHSNLRTAIVEPPETSSGFTFIEITTLQVFGIFCRVEQVPLF